LEACLPDRPEARLPSPQFEQYRTQRKQGRGKPRPCLVELMFDLSLSDVTGRG